MPRQPTGRPVGRPKGTTKLGAYTRITIKVPLALYDRLEAYADNLTSVRGGSPQLAAASNATPRTWPSLRADLTFAE